MNNEITVNSQEDLHRSWPDVTYKSNAFFNAFYDALSSVEENFIENTELSSSQEVYVGYLKNSDEFLVGYDCWYKEEGMGSLAIRCKFDGQQIHIVAPKRIWHDFSFYSFRNSFYKELRKLHSDLIDLRLD